MDVRISSSGIEGSGVFVTREFLENETVGEYLGKIMLESEIPAGRVYCFSLDDHRVLEAIEHPLKYLNHSCDPNCEALQEGVRVFIRTIRKVAKGEELTIDYGFDPAWEIPCSCNSSRCKRIIGG